MSIDQRPSDLLHRSAPQPVVIVEELIPDFGGEARAPHRWRRKLVLVGTVAAAAAITIGVVQTVPLQKGLTGSPASSAPVATAAPTSTPTASTSVNASTLPTWPAPTAVGNVSARSLVTPPAGGVYHSRWVFSNGGAMETWTKPDGTLYIYQFPALPPGASPSGLYAPETTVLTAASVSHPLTFAELAAYPTDGKSVYAKLHAEQAGRGRSESLIQGYVWKRLGEILMYDDMAPQVTRRAIMAAAQLVPGATTTPTIASTGAPCLKVSRDDQGARSWWCFDQATGSVIESGNGIVGQAENWVDVITITEYVSEVPAQVVAAARPA